MFNIRQSHHGARKPTSLLVEKVKTEGHRECYHSVTWDVQCGTRTRHPKDFEHISWNFINTLDSEEEESGSDEIGLFKTSRAGIRRSQSSGTLKIWWRS